MASRRTTKRKSPCQDTIFLEVNDNDLSPEHHGNEDSEPEFKIMKTDIAFLTEQPLENFNLQNENETSISEELKSDVVNNEVISCTISPLIDEKDDLSHKNAEDTEVCDGSPNKDCHIPDSSNSTIQISFNNKKIADLYKFKFIKFIESFVELEVVSETDLSITFQRDDLLDSSEWVILDETHCSEDIVIDPPKSQNDLKSPKNRKKKAKKKKKDDDIFVLDTKPSENEHNFNTLRYSSKFEIDSEKKVENIAQKMVSNQTCFNCDGNHSLRDCQVPRNAYRINVAKNKFKVQKQGVRYHVEDQKYGHLVPGKISNALRNALGLRRNELPHYIYHMRRLGYPPGWLEEAKYVYSDLDMFDGEGNTVRQINKKRQKLNPEKIIEYPGYNVPAEKYIKDEYYKYRVPPYSDKFRKEKMIEHFEQEFSKQQDNYDDCEMDLDERKNVIEEKSTKDNTIVKNVQETTDTCLPSPSLVELEKQKENLLLALEDNTSSNVISEENTNEANSGIEDQDDIQLTRVEDCIDLDNSTDERMSDSEKPSTSSAIKTSVLGTPILKSHSPYSKLPNMDNFTKDVSPVINFENLPNSTGKYEQMTGVLQKVRTKLKDLQNCKS